MYFDKQSSYYFVVLLESFSLSMGNFHYLHVMRVGTFQGVVLEEYPVMGNLSIIVVKFLRKNVLTNFNTGLI